MICPILLAAQRARTNWKGSTSDMWLSNCIGESCAWFNLCQAIQQADSIKLVPERKKK